MLNFGCVVHLGCFNKNTTDWVVYKQKKLISHNSGGWEVRDQWASKLGVWWEPSTWIMDNHLLTVFSPGKRDEAVLWSLFYKDTNPIREGSIIMT